MQKVGLSEFLCLIDLFIVFVLDQATKIHIKQKNNSHGHYSQFWVISVTFNFTQIGVACIKLYLQ